MCEDVLSFVFGGSSPLVFFRTKISFVFLPRNSPQNRQNKKEQKRVCFLLSVSSGIERWKNTTNYDDQRDRASTRATYAASKATKP
tara:strand:- start:658 stop:915 length:258 start_codon:yes stop_codon:yes gene_type:complete